MKQKIIHKDGSPSFCELMVTDWQLLKTKLLLATLLYLLLSDYHTDMDFLTIKPSSSGQSKPRTKPHTYLMS